MFKHLTKAVPVVSEIAAKTIRARMSTEASDNAVKHPRSIEIPAWGLVVLGSSAAGFFGKMLHDDNMATRDELRDLRKETHDLRKEMQEGFSTIRDEIKLSRTAG